VRATRGRPPTTPHAARCTACHGVGSCAVPPTNRANAYRWFLPLLMASCESSRSLVRNYSARSRAPLVDLGTITPKLDDYLVSRPCGDLVQLGDAPGPCPCRAGSQRAVAAVRGTSRVLRGSASPT
jgi:hypothetical protein